MKKTLSYLLAFALVLCLGACGGKDAPASPSSPEPENGSSQGAAPLPPTDLTMGTAATSGTYYFVGAAIGNTVSKASGSLEVLVASTAGGVENIGLVSSGEIDIGMANTDALYDAYNGTGSFGEAGKRPIMGLMALYPSVSHMLVRKDSSIQSWQDLAGKKVCLGTAGSSHAVASKALLGYYGIDWEKDLEAYYLTTGEMCTMLSDGDIDAAFLVGGAPVSGVTNACVTTPLELLDLEQEKIDSLLGDLPYFTQSSIPADTYSGISHPVEAVALTTCFFVNEDMPEEVAYEFVKTVMENTADFVDANESCKYITPQTVAELPIPIHPGALRYYQEQGWLQ